MGKKEKNTSDEVGDKLATRIVALYPSGVKFGVMANFQYLVWCFRFSSCDILVFARLFCRLKYLEVK